MCDDLWELLIKLKHIFTVCVIFPKERKKQQSYYRAIFTQHSKNHAAENDLVLYPNENGLQL